MAIDPARYHLAETFIKTLHPSIGPNLTVQLVAMQKRPNTRPYVREAWMWDLRQPVLRNALEMNDQGWDIYLTVNPFLNVGSRTKHNVAYVHAIVVDVDTKKTGVPLDAVVAEWRRLKIEPSLVVNSGNGGHVYFVVEPSDKALAEKQNQRICVHTRTDAVFDCTRILRLPGTVNWKQPATWCTWLENTGVRYTLDDLRERLDRTGFTALNDEPRAPVALAPVPATAAAAVAQLPIRIRAVVETGDTAGFQSNSEADFAVMHALVTVGATDEQITAVYAGYPIRAAKVAGAAAHYFHRTLDRARRLAEMEQQARAEQENLPQPPFVRTGPGRFAIRMEEKYSAKHFYDGI